MEENIDLYFTVSENDESLRDFVLSHDDYNADEGAIKPQDPSLMKWFAWLMERESDAFFEAQGCSMEGGEAMLGFMPENPKKFAEAMLLLLEHAGATNLRAHWYSPDRDDAGYTEFTLENGKMIGVRKPIQAEG